MFSGANTVEPFAARLYSLLQPLHATINDQESASDSALGLAETGNFGYGRRAAIQTSINHLENVFGDRARVDIVNLEQSEMDMPIWWM